ncbi:MAG: AMP-binding protein [Fulvivirga sp.]
MTKSTEINIDSHQRELLIKQLEYVNTHSQFYKNHFKRHNFNSSEVKCPADLKRLPTIDKRDIQNDYKAFWCVGAKQVVDYTNTSGTEGKPITIPMTQADLKRLAYNEQCSLQLAGGDSHEIYQLTTTTDRRFMAGLAYTLGAHKLGAGLVRMGPGLPELQWRTIDELQTTALIIVPSFLVKLISYAEEQGIDYKNTSVKKAICIGEPIRDGDFSLNALGRRIKDAWDIELYSTYASSEMATAFTECKAGKGGHLLPNLVIAEILDEDGNEVPDGQPGELTITTLGVEGFPLVRFRTGDICTKHSAPCSCGRTTPRLGPVVGRKHQMIKVKGTTCYPPAIFNVLDNIPQISHYQIEISNDEFGNDQLLVRYAVSEDVSKKTLIEHFKSGIRLTPQLELMSSQDLVPLIHQPSSRKPVKLVDLRKK